MRRFLAALLTAAAFTGSAPALAQEAPQAEPVPLMPQEDLTASEREVLHAEIRAYLLSHPEILMEMYALLEQKQQAATAEADRKLIAEHKDELFEDGYSYVGGNPEGDVTIVEFLDYSCGFCRRAHPELAELIDADGNIRWIVKEYPILGPNSELAARAAVATLISEGEEAYGRLNDTMMRQPTPVDETSLDAALSAAGVDPAKIRAGMSAPEVTERLTETRALGEAMGISGTPSFIFETELVRGYVPIAEMRTLVENIRMTN